MLNALKETANMTHTENGAAAYRSTMSGCLDLFAGIGALRHASDEEIIDRFLCAYVEDADLAMKTLFFGRDVRGGLGERRVFRTVLRWLAETEPQSVEKNIPHIAEYGRFDDLLVLLGTPCEAAALAFIKKQLESDLAAMKAGENVSLLAKWLPSVNASSRQTVLQGKRIARALGMEDARYRKTLAALRGYIGILENSLRKKAYTFDYAKQPSKAMLKYRKAFWRNDNARYSDFLDRVAAGKATLHTGTLVPYDVVKPMFKGGGWSCSGVTRQERKAMEVAWNALEDFTNGENALVVVDGSGSMYGPANPCPAAVAMSLGVYFAERNTGAFKGHFITFSKNPQLVEVKGRDIYAKVRYCSRFNEVANTDLQRVFELVLEAAVKNGLPQEEMPEKLYIISDMEFDQCVEGGSLTNFEYARQRYEQAGYRLPQVVFWNVASRNRQQPVAMNDAGAVLVSGCSPRVFSMVKTGEFSPYVFMLEVLGGERYAPIAA